MSDKLNPFVFYDYSISSEINGPVRDVARDFLGFQLFNNLVFKVSV